MQMSHHYHHHYPKLKPSSRRRSNLDSSSSSSSRGAAETSSREIPIQQLPQPNVIARLMGIDAVPIVIQAHGHPTLLNPPAATASAAAAAEAPPLRQQDKCSSLLGSYRSSRDPNRNSSKHYHCLMNKMRVPGRSRSRQRRHPQEDLLRKIRHDFQATWQQAASNATDSSYCSATSAARLRTATSSSAQLSDGSSIIQMVAQENLRKQKMARYALAIATTTAMEDGNCATSSMQPTDDDEPTKPEDPCAGAAASGKFRDVEGASGEELRSPTTIVLLKPRSSSDADAQQGQESLFGLPKVTRDGNMSRFLLEVKGMLQQQLKTTTPTWGTEPQQIGCDIANQTGQTVAKHKRFFRSESFRGFRSDRNKRKEEQASSPEHVRIVNHLLAHRITSRARPRATTDTVPSPKKDDEESVSSSCSITSRERVRSLADVSPSASAIGIGPFGFGEQSFRSECPMKHKDDSTASSSARALFRSFSAPELGFAFSLGRLLGDGSVSSTAHGVASEGAAAMTSKNTAAFGFIRGTVSSFRRHSFSLRKNLFRRKMHWSKKTSLAEIHPQMAIGTAPPSPPETFNLFKVAQANLIELPPSPVSPLEVAGHNCRHLFSDFDCTLPELSPKCLSEFEAPASEISCRTDVTVETACDQDKAYIREVLVAAGLYDDGALDNKANARVDSMARPICDDIFEEVEDMYYYRGKYCDDAIAMCSSDAGGNAADHRMLFDLANEALQSLVRQAEPSSTLRQWILDSTGVSRGRRLVDDVWQQVQTLRNPQMQEMQTIDSMTTYEIRKSAWDEVLYEDVYVVARKIERAIFDELIEDLMTEVFI